MNVEIPLEEYVTLLLHTRKDKLIPYATITRDQKIRICGTKGWQSFCKVKDGDEESYQLWSINQYKIEYEKRQARKLWHDNRRMVALNFDAKVQRFAIALAASKGGPIAQLVTQQVRAGFYNKNEGTLKTLGLWEAVKDLYEEYHTQPPANQ